MKTRHLAALGALVGLPAATYAGYPALVWLMANLRSRPHVTDPDFEPFVTVVIAAHNEAAIIGTKVRNVFEQDYSPDRLAGVVVCDGCTDDTANNARAAGDRRLNVVELPRQRGKLAATRSALPDVQGEIIVFTDANALLQPGALRNLVAPFADPSVVVVSGAKHVRDGPESIYWRYERWLRARESAGGSVAGADGALYAVRAAAVDASARAGAADDLLISLRAVRHGGRIVFAPKARTTEAASPNGSRTFAARTRTTSGALFALECLPGLFHPRRGDLWWKLVGHKLLRITTPPVMVAGAVALAVPESSARWRVWAASFALAGLLCSFPSNGRLGRGRALARYALLANLAALAGLGRFVARRPIDAWSPARPSPLRKPTRSTTIPRRLQM